MKVFRSKRGVSPVIATVILVATAITIAVAVAYWMGGITSQYTRFEKVEIVSVYCESTQLAYWGDTEVNGVDDGSVATDCWSITLSLRNTGTTEATLIGAFINGKAIADYGEFSDEQGDLYDLIQAFDEQGVQVDFSAGDTVTIEPGSSTELIVVIKQDSALTFTSGTTIELSLHSGAGNSYMKMVTLT
jgi:flagellin-like protein